MMSFVTVKERRRRVILFVAVISVLLSILPLETVSDNYAYTSVNAAYRDCISMCDRMYTYSSRDPLTVAMNNGCASGCGCYDEHSMMVMGRACLARF